MNVSFTYERIGERPREMADHLKIMAATAKLFLIITTVSLAVKVQAKLGIVEPFPRNLYPIQFTSAQVTCVAFDPSGENIPSEIRFLRRDDFNIYHQLKGDKNFYFENRTEIHGNNTKLFVTMHITNVTLEEDSLFGDKGRYLCQAFAVGDALPKGFHGFIVSVITRSEIPKVSVFPPDDVHSMQHNDHITLICNVTDTIASPGTRLKRISWFKNGDLLESVRYPNPSDPKDTLRPIVLKSISEEDGGNYTCLLEVALRSWKPYEVSDHTVIHVTPWFTSQNKTEITKEPGQAVKLECSAKGFPLRVEWRIKKNANVRSLSCVAPDEHYNISRRGEHSPSFLTIRDLDKKDSASYFCCLSSNCSANVDADECQRFDVTVTGDSTTEITTDNTTYGGTTVLTSYPMLLTLTCFLWFSFFGV